jgi:hypothetical protein
MKRRTRAKRAERAAQSRDAGNEQRTDAAAPTFESWLLRAKRGQVLAVYVDGVELSRAAWEADGDRIHLRTPIAQVDAVTAAVRRAGASTIVGAEPVSCVSRRPGSGSTRRAAAGR